MKHPKVKKPRRRHRLNIKKFAVIVLVLGCAATLIALAAKANQETAMSKTDIKADKDIEASQSAPDATKNATQGAPDKTQKTDLTNPLKGRLIVVDAGHGGFDPGAIGISGTYESKINLAIAKYLETEFKSCGAKVIMTRNDDSGLGTTQDESLEERRQIIEQSGSDIVVSIHMNSYKEDPNMSGPLVLFMPGSEKGKKLAEAAQQSMNKELNAEGSARSENLYILKSGNQACILVECGYISNKTEERKLKQKDYQQKVAKSICKGVKEFFIQVNTQG